jgi:hypothetical protein
MCGTSTRVDTCLPSRVAAMMVLITAGAWRFSGRDLG